MKLADVAARVERYFNIRAQTKADFVVLVMEIAGNNVMAALAQFVNQTRANCA